MVSMAMGIVTTGFTQQLNGKNDDRKKEHEKPDPPRGSERGKEREKRETTGNNDESEKRDSSREYTKSEGRETLHKDDRGERRDSPRSKPKEEIRSSSKIHADNVVDANIAVKPIFPIAWIAVRQSIAFDF
ncbi:hypothetical protein BOTCAL_0603g00050 [Botryotinia calthae]|uniref:Uncharacterized protein n=1 Tax=Botryotinia calthae TaxID=38488 RepID=A0A4Y8CLJ6_9HELO|nr:hypothetical protein BOTCAL_0603g00050 [Botryotinia calthae]